MSLTEQIVDIVERARARGAPNEEVDRYLQEIGCTRVVHRSDTVIVYYEHDGTEAFVICAP
jgi:hypothetical protein